MKILVLSDLHNEFHPFIPPDNAAGADAVILAGDIDVGTRGVEWANRAFSRPVIYLLGNHEFYGGELGRALESCRAAAAPQVHVLENDAVTIDGVRFLGATLWTDFRLFGADLRAAAMTEAERCLTDYRRIRVVEGSGYRRMRAADTVRMHRASRAWLAEQFAQGHPGRTIVVTHHAPHRGSLAPEYAIDVCSPAFVSDVADLMGRPSLWIHGHTHTSFDYEVSGTRVVCNPRGYWKDELNPAFNPSFTVDIQP